MASSAVGINDALMKLEHCELFFLTIRTTGFPGLDIFKDAYGLLQIHCIHIISQTSFLTYARTKASFFCEASKQSHLIPYGKVSNEVVGDAQTILKNWYMWCFQKSSRNSEGNHKTPIFITYDDEKTRDCVLKLLPLKCGKEGELLTARFLDMKLKHILEMVVRQPDLSFKVLVTL